jgi:hypothetical protein
VDWGIVADSVVAAGTLVLAAATFVLAKRASAGNALTQEELRLARASQSATIRPVLVDVAPSDRVEATSYLEAGEVYSIPTGTVHVVELKKYVRCSVPFRNIGDRVRRLSRDWDFTSGDRPTENLS